MAAEPSDIRSVQTAIKVQIPTTHISMHLMFQGFNILLATLLKPGLCLALELSHFNIKFMNKEPFHMSHLQGVDPKYGPAHMVHYIQLCTHAFFVDVLNPDTLAEAAAVPVPQFQAHLRDTVVGDVATAILLHHAPQGLGSQDRKQE